MTRAPEVVRSLFFNTHVGNKPMYEYLRINGNNYYLNRKRLLKLEDTINLLCECLTRIESKLKELEQFNSLLEVLYEIGEGEEDRRVLFGEDCYGDLIILSISKQSIYLPVEKTKSTYSYSTDYVLEFEKEKYANKISNPLVLVFLKEQNKRQHLYYKQKRISNLIEACIEKYLISIFDKKYDFESYLVELQVDTRWFVFELEREWRRPVNLMVKLIWSGENHLNIPLDAGAKIKINNKKSKKLKSSFGLDSLYERAKLDAKQKDIETKLKEYGEFTSLFETVVEKSIGGTNPKDALLYLLDRFKEIQNKMEV